MFLKELYIYQFKNIEEAQLIFSASLNFIFGENGAGKTNILDAIHYLSLTKSFINTIDTENILTDTNFFKILGRFSNEENIEEYTCIVNKEGRKHFKYFTKDYSRLAEHVGKIPIVVISPFDQFYISEGSEFRRKLLDASISQYDKVYLGYLYEYNRILKQRNSLLKSEHIESIKLEMLEILNLQLVKPAEYLHKSRKTFIDGIQKKINNFYAQISNKENEKINLEYRSPLNENNYKLLLEENIKKDILAETTTIGIHKDDILFKLNMNPIKYYASQGQQKTYLTALKLSILNFLRQFNTKPLLLLDDIFDKLDDNRVRNLIKAVMNEGIQVFITHTDKDRFIKLNIIDLPDMHIFKVNNGNIIYHEQQTAKR